MTRRVGQESAAPLEDLLKGGLIGVDDISDTDKARIADNVYLQPILDGKVTIKKQEISDRMIT